MPEKTSRCPQSSLLFASYSHPRSRSHGPSPALTPASYRYPNGCASDTSVQANTIYVIKPLKRRCLHNLSALRRWEGHQSSLLRFTRARRSFKIEKIEIGGLEVEAAAYSAAFDIVVSNITSPAVLAFALGGFSTFLKTSLRFPAGLQQAISTYLLLAVGIKGGVAITEVAEYGSLAAPIAAALFLGMTKPVISYLAMRKGVAMSLSDASAMAAHYGGISAVTFFQAMRFTSASGHPAEDYLNLVLHLMGLPGIIVALTLYSFLLRAEQLEPSDSPELDRVYAESGRPSILEALREVLFGRSIVLSVGGIFVGMVLASSGHTDATSFFSEFLDGFLVLFLLDLGIISASRFQDFLTLGPKLTAYAILSPILNGLAGLTLGHLIGLSQGGQCVFASLAASASYIAAPAAVRSAIPESNPAYATTCALAITFPFNTIVGVPLFYALAAAWNQ